MLLPRPPMLRSLTLVALAGLFPLLAIPARGQSDAGRKAPPLPDTKTIRAGNVEIEMRVVARDLEHPWALAFLPDGRMLVTERNEGRLRIVDQSGRVSEPVEDVPTVFRFKGETGRSQAGLFDVKLHPRFSENQQIYLSYARPTERGASVTVIRARLAGASEPRLEDHEEIFDLKEDDQDSSGLHFGGRMALDERDGMLYLSIGERRNISRAQDGKDQAGSILRVTLDGEVPPSNPFLNDAGHDDHIFAKGNRNSQALAIHPETRRLWTVDHGPLGGDKVNAVKPGANLGWPYINAGKDYSGAPLGSGTRHDGMTSPDHVFEETVAPSGATFYTGDMFREWRGHLLAGGLANQAIMRIAVDGDRVMGVSKIEIGRRVRDVQVGPDGAIWLLTEHADGELVRLAPKR